MHPYRHLSRRTITVPLSLVASLYRLSIPDSIAARLGSIDMYTGGPSVPMLAFRYAPPTSAVHTFRCSFAAIANNENTDIHVTVVADRSSPSYRVRSCWSPLATSLDFILSIVPSGFIFCLTNILLLMAPLMISGVSSPGGIGVANSLFTSCCSSPSIESVAMLPCSDSACLQVILDEVTSAYTCMSSVQ